MCDYAALDAALHNIEKKKKKCGVMKIPISLKKYIQSSVNSSLVSVSKFSHNMPIYGELGRYPLSITIKQRIGLYRDVWIAAIASSTTSLATRTAAICVRFQGRRVRRVTSQCRLRSLRENPIWSIDGIYVRESPASLSIAMAFWR